MSPDILLVFSLLLGTSIVCELHITRKQYLDGSIPTGFQRTAITGIDGIARGLANRTYPGGDNQTTPLFDGQGNPLPEEKNNGTWREDNSGGHYPNYVWVDSCSRDMFFLCVHGGAGSCFGRGKRRDRWIWPVLPG